jgi:hypothetical protein
VITPADRIDVDGGGGELGVSEPFLHQVHGLAAARKQGRKGGRPRVLDKEKTRVAEAMLKDTVNYPFVGDVIEHLSDQQDRFLPIFPAGPHPGTPKSRLSSRPGSCRFTYLCVKEP